MVKRRRRRVSKKSVPLYEKIGNEVINETITAGLSFLIIIFGVNYFNFRYAWASIIGVLGKEAGLSNSMVSQEVGSMLSTIGNTFPFNYLLGSFNLKVGFVIGIIIVVIGVGLKIATRTSKEKFIADMGRNIYSPAIVGFFSMIILQVLLALFAAGEFSGLIGRLDSGLFIWRTYGSLVIVGIIALLFGSAFRLIARNQKSAKLRMGSNVILHSAYISLVYYGVLRFFALDFFLSSSVGGFFKVFLVAGDVSSYVILFCIFTFSLGFEINRYGKFLMKKKRLFGK